MAKTKTVPLSAPIKGHASEIRQVVVREPTGWEHIELGDPFTIARTNDGVLYTVPNDHIIQAYLEKCIVEPDVLLLKQTSLADGIAIRGALLAFFLEARGES